MIAKVLSWVIVIALVGYVGFQAYSLIHKLISKRRSKIAELKNNEKGGTKNDGSKHVDGTHDGTH